MHQLRKGMCQESFIRYIAFALGHDEILFPNYDEIREEICRLYNFYYCENEIKIKLIANEMRINEEEVVKILHSENLCDYLMHN